MKRRIAIVLLLLAGGAVVNVAVAWGLSVVDPYQLPAERHRITEGHLGWWREHSQFGFIADTQIVRSQLGYRHTVLASLLMNEYCTLVRTGLPMLSLERSSRIGAWEVDQRDALTIVEQSTIVVPLRPILPGFIINTLFYALLLWLLFFAPFTVRRMIRRRRGQCEKCAYPIGVSPVCTECGAAVSRNEPRARQNEPRA